MKYRVADLEGALLDAAVAVCEGLIRGRWDYGRERVDPNPRSVEWWRADGSDCYCLADASQRDKNLADGVWAPSSDWAYGGPIIERERIFPMPMDEGETGWTASKYEASWADPDDIGHEREMEGPTPLVAAMRCFVVWRQGEEVEL